LIEMPIDEFDDKDLRKELIKLMATVIEINTTVKHIQKQVDDNSEMTKSFYALTSNVDKLATTLDNSAKQTQADVNSFRESVKRMGERIEKLETEPAHKWKTLITQVVQLAVAAGFGYLVSIFIK